MSIIKNKRTFLKGAKHTLSTLVDELDNLPVLDSKDLSNRNTAVIVIDMVNGFAKEGNLFSPRIKDMIPYVEEKLLLFEGFNKVFFVDEHSKTSKEFENYPEHCLVDTDESKLIKELQPFLEDFGEIIPKNSTNGFVTKGFAEWLGKHPKINNYVIMGDCTDLCILQFALTLKSYLNEWDVTSHVIVPIKGVETYQMDESNHQAELMNVFALYNMQMNGIELAKDIY